MPKKRTKKKAPPPFDVGVLRRYRHACRPAPGKRGQRGARSKTKRVTANAATREKNLVRNAGIEPATFSSGG